MNLKWVLYVTLLSHSPKVKLELIRQAESFEQVREILEEGISKDDSSPADASWVCCCRRKAEAETKLNEWTNDPQVRTAMRDRQRYEMTKRKTPVAVHTWHLVTRVKTRSRTKPCHRKSGNTVFYFRCCPMKNTRPFLSFKKKKLYIRQNLKYEGNGHAYFFTWQWRYIYILTMSMNSNSKQ